ncbi:MAG TPA: threonine aldolase, partial [Candidatus Latescibacteria bacterium]|nr:threonine aldolase [Candidatus Latescibacterota bacterium]
SETRAFPVFNGTAANVLSAAGVIEPHQAVICASTSHIHFDECGAIERFVGCRVLTIGVPHGKIEPASLQQVPDGHGPPHQSQPRVLSITQSSELGTVYTSEEVQRLADTAHDRGWLLHMDGARLANAAAALDLPLRAITRDVGVDLLSFGGTKCGLLGGEVVLVLTPGLAPSMPYARKQGLQLASKMRFLSAQFLALLTDELWREMAQHANDMARRLHDEVRDVPGLVITHPQESNAVFARLPAGALARLRQDWRMAIWDVDTSEVRWMASWDTTPADVDDFALAIRVALTTTD